LDIKGARRRFSPASNAALPFTAVTAGDFCTKKKQRGKSGKPRISHPAHSRRTESISSI